MRILFISFKLTFLHVMTHTLCRVVDPKADLSSQGRFEEMAGMNMSEKSDGLDNEKIHEDGQPDTEKEQAEPDSELEFSTVRQIWQNVLVICAGFLFLFTAYLAMESLQASLFIEEGMGTVVLAVIYGSFTISAIFLPSAMISVFGCKWTVIISMATYVMFTMAYFYARWELFIPAAVLLGIGAAPLWTAQSHYFNKVAHTYAKKKGITNDAAANLLFGVFFLIFRSTSIWGSIISSQVLTPADANYSFTPLTDEELSLCGKAFCPQIQNSNNTNLERPPDSKIYTLAGIFTGCSLIALVLVSVFLQDLPSERQSRNGCRAITGFQPKLILASFLQMRDVRQLLLIPFTIYTGVEVAFVTSDITQAFITCPFGNWWIGYVMICFGIVNAVCSILFGKLVQFVGRSPFFILAALTNVAVLMALLHLDSVSDDIYLYFVFVGLWGMADAVWQTQTTALYGVIFKDNSEGAFSNFQIWQSLGFITAFAYQSQLCLPTKVYILLSVLGLGMVGYGMVEYLEWRERRDNSAIEK